jgi:hypothetical protein
MNGGIGSVSIGLSLPHLLTFFVVVLVLFALVKLLR